MKKHKCEQQFEEYKELMSDIKNKGEYQNIKTFVIILIYDILNNLDSKLAEENDYNISISLDSELKVEIYKLLCYSVEDIFINIIENSLIQKYDKEQDIFTLLEFSLDTVIIPTINSTIKSILIGKLNIFILDNNLNRKYPEFEEYALEIINEVIENNSSYIFKAFTNSVRMMYDNNNSLEEINKGAKLIISSIN